MKTVKGRSVYSVSEVNSLARQTLENISFWVEGEVSAFKGANTHYRYIYFDLKDPQSGFKLPCILEPDTYLTLGFELEDGSKILTLGNLTLYEKEAKFQMYLHKIEQFGEGLLLTSLEKLKKKLESQGYFDLERKKPLPHFPTNLAVISSKIADAWFDFKKHTISMFPLIKITFFDVMVQGSSSSDQIVENLKKADKMGFDAIVLIRGGGSLEDLASFNDEKVADSIFKAKTCIVVGVGHEKDVTLAQLVADVAASTPTDAAKIITADFVNLEQNLNENLMRLKKAINYLQAASSQEFDLLFHRLIFHQEKFKEIPRNLMFLKKSLFISENALIFQNQQKLATILTFLSNHWRLAYQKNGDELQVFKEKLLLLSPRNILKRGYSITTDQRNHIIRDVHAIDIGSIIKVKFARGKAKTKVIAKEL